MIGEMGYRELAREARTNPEQSLRELAAGFRQGHIRATDFSIRRLAEAFLGPEWFRLSDPRVAGGGFVPMHVMEAGGTAVMASQFINISGQIFFNGVLEGFNSPMMQLSMLVPTMGSNILGPEIIGGVSRLGDANQVVGEAEPYPQALVAQDYIQLPAGIKRGTIVDVTREAILADQTGWLLRRCNEVGEWLGFNKECRIIDTLIDENDTKGRYNWRGTTYATYASSGGHGVVNLKTSNGLVTHANIDAAQQLFWNMVDPNTATPILVAPTHILVTPSLDATCANLLGANQLNVATSGYPTSGSPVTAQVNNRWRFQYQQITSQMLAYRMGTDTNWFLSNPAKHMVYKENWPLTVSAAPANSPADFERDIMHRYKANERGAAGTADPRFTVKNTVA